ncbi:class I SAM-dependent methyltransferase [candidate division KSB1 bacterium]|nr:class I SAM-dependent methyltransferase [candidate division KSB1 bacterium]
MTQLYSRLARVYHEMYQSIFDYAADFRFFDEYLKKYHCHSILELGCGSGNLAPYFIKNGYAYTGLDLAEEMLQIARNLYPQVDFIQGDMRAFCVNLAFDAVIISGRSFTYMTTNDDVFNALKSIHFCLKPDGILIFDNFNAETIFLNFKPEAVLTIEQGTTRYKRVSRSTWNLQTGWTWNWQATYYIRKAGEAEEVIEDHSILRAFTEQELALFLKLSNFDIEEIISDKTFVSLARKK